MSYKLEWLGGIFLKVCPRYTSRRCSACQLTSKESRVSQSIFRCISCLHTENADTNAAKNILAAGHAVLACGEAAFLASMQQGTSGNGQLSTSLDIGITFPLEKVRMSITEHLLDEHTDIDIQSDYIVTHNIALDIKQFHKHSSEPKYTNRTYPKHHFHLY